MWILILQTTLTACVCVFMTFQPIKNYLWHIKRRFCPLVSSFKLVYVILLLILVTFVFVNKSDIPSTANWKSTCYHISQPNNLVYSDIPFQNQLPLCKKIRINFNALESAILLRNTTPWSINSNSCSFILKIKGKSCIGIIATQ